MVIQSGPPYLLERPLLRQSPFEHQHCYPITMWILSFGSYWPVPFVFSWAECWDRIRFVVIIRVTWACVAQRAGRPIWEVETARYPLDSKAYLGIRVSIMMLVVSLEYLIGWFWRRYLRGEGNLINHNSTTIRLYQTSSLLAKDYTKIVSRMRHHCRFYTHHIADSLYKEFDINIRLLEKDLRLGVQLP